MATILDEHQVIPVVEAPVITATDDRQMQSLAAFMDGLRSNPVAIAAAEAARIQPYLAALSRRIMMDAQAAQTRSLTSVMQSFTAAARGGAEYFGLALPVSGTGSNSHRFIEPQPERVATLAETENLSLLFTALAKRSGNTILSDMIILPQSALKHEAANKNATQFSGAEHYKGASYTLGFMQVFSDDKKNSTSVPLFAFDDAKMDAIASHAPEELLRAFQTIMVAGNHDMQHHYTSSILNPSISKSFNARDYAIDERLRVQGWAERHFSDSFGDKDPKSYESWLMLSHARVRRLMEDGPEALALQRACDTFMDELKRIGTEMLDAGTTAKDVHSVVNYFGTGLGFAMMRYMPMNHPLLTHAMSRLAEADPLPDTIINRGKELGDYYTRFPDKAISNFKALGLDLSSNKKSYADAKKLELIDLAPWIARLIGPSSAKDHILAETHNRTPNIMSSMVSAAAFDAMFQPFAGTQAIDLGNGKTLEITNAGNRHALDQSLQIVETNSRTRTEKWLKGGKLHREDGPALLKTSTGSEIYRHEEEWHQNGQLHRKDGPAMTSESAQGDRIQRWYVNGQAHNDHGPAVVNTYADGTYVEYWYKNDVLDREDGPAEIRVKPDGSREEKWYKNGREVDMSPCVLMYSDEEAMDKGFKFYAQTENGQTVVYTACLTPEEAETYDFADKKIVWSGPRSHQTPQGMDKVEDTRDYVLVYSAAAAALDGVCYAETPDGKTHEYTALTLADKLDKYQWADKEVLWQGLKAEQKFLRSEKTAKKQFEEFLNDIPRRSLPKFDASPFAMRMAKL